MNHVLYYYTQSEITKLLALNPNSVLYATLHKLDGPSGTVNCGEQSYQKDLVTGDVVQTNVETGEVYEHPDPAQWFRDFEYADGNGAIAWTVNKGCDDTYVFTFTSTERSLVRAKNMNLGNGAADTLAILCNERVDPPPAYTVEEVTFTSQDLLPSSLAAKEITVRISHPKLYDTLKHFMVNKPRNARTLQDLTAKAHREVGNNVLVGGRPKIKIDPSTLTQHIFAAWMAGAHEEAAMFEAVVTSAHASASVNRNLSGKSLAFGNANAVKQALRAALLTSVVAKSKAPIHEVIAQFDQLV